MLYEYSNDFFAASRVGEMGDAVNCRAEPAVLDLMERIERGEALVGCCSKLALSTLLDTETRGVPSAREARGA